MNRTALEARGVQALALLALDRAERERLAQGEMAHPLTDAQRDDCTTALRLADEAVHDG